MYYVNVQCSYPHGVLGGGKKSKVREMSYIAQKIETKLTPPHPGVGGFRGQNLSPGNVVNCRENRYNFFTPPPIHPTCGRGSFRGQHLKVTKHPERFSIFLFFPLSGVRCCLHLFTASSAILLHPPLSPVFYFQSPSPPVFFTSLLTRTVLPSQPWPPSSPPALLSKLCRSLR